jgi:hypothetical protein
MTSTLHFPGRSGEVRDVLVARLAAIPHAPESADVPVDGLPKSMRARPKIAGRGFYSLRRRSTLRRGHGRALVTGISSPTAARVASGTRRGQR